MYDLDSRRRGNDDFSNSMDLSSPRRRDPVGARSRIKSGMTIYIHCSLVTLSSFQGPF